jgi:hypothetical protein
LFQGLATERGWEPVPDSEKAKELAMARAQDLEKARVQE